MDEKYEYANLPISTKYYVQHILAMYNLLGSKSIVGKKTLKNRQMPTLDRIVLAILLAAVSCSKADVASLIYNNGLDLKKLTTFAQITYSEVNDIIDGVVDKMRAGSDKLPSEYEELYNDVIGPQLAVFKEDCEKKEKIIIKSADICTLVYSLGCIGYSVIFLNHELEGFTDSMERIHNELKKICFKDGFIINAPKRPKKSEPLAEKFEDIIRRTFPLAEQQKLELDKVEESQTSTKSLQMTTEEILGALGELREKYVAQERPCEELLLNLCHNQRIIDEASKITDITERDNLLRQKSVILLDGPTGTGKTSITTDIAEKLKVPFIEVSMPNYSAAGYKGDDLLDILERLYKKANGDVELAERGIVLLDEFDKIGLGATEHNDMKVGVQQQLLKFIEGNSYSVGGGKADIDTSKISFVCSGAYTELRDKKLSAKQRIGFSDEEQSEITEYTITPDDLTTHAKIMRELAARLKTSIHTDNYSKADLKRILLESPISPLVGFKSAVKMYGKTLEIDEEAYDVIVDAAYELKTGVRGLETVMNSIKNMYLKDIMIGSESLIHITVDDVKKAIHGINYRQVRG